jgi:HD-GYP domain-containing protein (c-di-GMP phosphodiesterase class II)
VILHKVKTVPALKVYRLAGFEHPELDRVLADLGLEPEPLADPASITAPALILLPPGQPAPEGLADYAISPPVDAAAPALRELLRVALENVVLRQEVKQLEEEARSQHRQFEELNRIGIALSAERDIKKLQDFILTTMRQLTNADGASLWLKRMGEDGNPKLFFASVQNYSLDADTYRAFELPVDEKTVVGYTVTVGASQIYEDAYVPPAGKPAGGGAFDKQYGYRTKSMMCVPMRSHTNDVVGAIQLINAKRRFDTRLTPANVDAEVVSFPPRDLEMIESIASQAAVALDNKTLLDSIQALFDGFVQASVTAIEQRDPTTAGHSNRVEALTSGIAQAVSHVETGRFRVVHFTDDQLKELRYACLLHDFGKVGVREHILIKAKKLIPGQLEVIQARFEYVERSIQYKFALEKLELLKAGKGGAAGLAEVDIRLGLEMANLQQWLQGIVSANEPSVLPEDKASMLEFLSKQTYVDLSGQPHPLLDEQEFRFLSIKKGTLDEEERLEMESHVTHSFHFLTKIPWTPAMKFIPEIAYGHHEKLDGSGYPRKLTADQIPLQAKMMTISDIYDALTAQDRPYKRAVPLERALDILNAEAKEGKLDPDLLELFIAKKVYDAVSPR